jgi:nicotinamide-nucleotide amidase
MRAEIITIGDELTSGSVQNTNATFIASQLHPLGIEVVKMTTVGDTHEDIIKALRSTQGTVSVALVTGGLGPTVDDITTKAASEAFRRKLLLNKEALKTMEERFQKFGRAMSSHNVRQAYLPTGATIVPNPIGTACGFHLAKDNTLFIFMPGVPREMQRMCEETVIPLLKRELPETSIVKSQLLKIFGKSESYCDQLLGKLIKKEREIRFAFLPHYPEITLKLTMRGNDTRAIEKKLKSVTRAVTRILGDIVFAEGEHTLEEVVGCLLKSQGATLAVAESCTGGLITHRLTNVPGSSEYIDRTLVVYSNTSKKALLKVPTSLLNRYGAVSKEVAEHMARGVRTSSKTTVGLAVTGIAGPAGGTPEKPVGTVFIALAHARSVSTEQLKFYGDREQIKFMTSQYALDILRKQLIAQ